MFAFVDTFILLLVLGLARAGWRRGFASQVIDLVGFSAAVVAALRFHDLAAAGWRAVGLGGGAASLAGGLTIFVPLIVAVAIVGAKVGRVVMQPGLRMTNKLAGVALGITWAAVGVTFALLVAQVAPVPLGLADAVRRSPTARLLLDVADPVTGVLQRIAERDGEKIVLYLRQGLAFSKPLPVDEEEPPVRFDPVDRSKLSRDDAAERELLRLVNAERTKHKLRPVRWDGRLAGAGRAHSLDMYEHGYFAHRDREGRTPAQRLRRADVAFLVSGENLALAPTVGMAHDGLMRSPGHRRNILDPDFSKLGVGIWKGPHGLIASQEFCGGC